MHGNGLLDDQTILEQTTDVLTSVGIGDLVDLIGVKPYSLLTAFQNGRREALLEAKVAGKTKLRKLSRTTSYNNPRYVKNVRFTRL